MRFAYKLGLTADVRDTYILTVPPQGSSQTSTRVSQVRPWLTPWSPKLTDNTSPQGTSYKEVPPEIANAIASATARQTCELADRACGVMNDLIGATSETAESYTVTPVLAGIVSGIVAYSCIYGDADPASFRAAAIQAIDMALERVPEGRAEMAAA